MSLEKKHVKCRLALVAMAVGVSIVQAATLPPPPVSPAPVTDYEYDANGNPTKVTKAKGVTGFGLATKNTYDPLDRLKTNVDAKSGITTLGYDGQDGLKQVTDPRNLVTQYQRNGLGDMTQLNSPDTGVANSTYDAAGNLLTRTDSRNVLGTYAYDALNRLKSEVYSQSGQNNLNIGWTYDQTGSPYGYGVGRLTTNTYPAGNTKYGYDAQGRLITSIQTVGTVVFTTRYTYDGARNLTSITYPSGRVLTITYQNGLASSMSVAKDATSAAVPLISQIQWEPFGVPRSWLMHLNTGTKAYERVFDSYGRLVRYPLNTRVRDLSYDAAGRIVSYKHLDATTGLSNADTQSMDQTFGYDELGRLASIAAASSSWLIGYDANGNRTNVTMNGTSRAYTTATTSNRLNQISNPVRSFGYDAMGNTLTDSSGYTATYYLTGRLASLAKAGVTMWYSYDGNGQRVRKQATTATHFVYLPDGTMLGEYGATATAPVHDYVWLGNMPVAVLGGTAAATEVFFVWPDHLNAPRVLADKNNAERWRWISEPFGSTVPNAAPSGLAAVNLNLRFPGQFFDKESGLHYNYFRDYDATIGRYLESDPIGLAGGLNTYAYVDGDPLSYSDPEGLAAIRPGRLPLIWPWNTTPSSRPVDPTDPHGPQYTPQPVLPDWARPLPPTAPNTSGPRPEAALPPAGAANAPMCSAPEDCRAEWQEAETYCRRLYDDGYKPKRGGRGIGEPTLRACIWGQVSERCGGSKVE